MHRPLTALSWPPGSPGPSGQESGEKCSPGHLREAHAAFRHCASAVVCSEFCYTEHFISGHRGKNNSSLHLLLTIQGREKGRAVWSFPRLRCHGKDDGEYEHMDVNHAVALSLRFRGMGQF